MEDTLRALRTSTRQPSLGLNPCFNGRYSQSLNNLTLAGRSLVLILVLMEDTLRVKNLKVKGVNLNVLILVLMEDTLRVGLGFAFAMVFLS